MSDLDNMDRLYIIWAFFFQIILIIHYAIRKPFFETYTLRYGWLVYSLCIPAVVISLILLRSGKSWSFWIGGFLFLLFAFLVIGLIMLLNFNGESRFAYQYFFRTRFYT